MLIDSKFNLWILTRDLFFACCMPFSSDDGFYLCLLLISYLSVSLDDDNLRIGCIPVFFLLLPDIFNKNIEIQNMAFDITLAKV